MCIEHLVPALELEYAEAQNPKRDKNLHIMGKKLLCVDEDSRTWTYLLQLDREVPKYLQEEAGVTVTTHNHTSRGVLRRIEVDQIVVDVAPALADLPNAMISLSTASLVKALLDACKSQEAQIKATAHMLRMPQQEASVSHDSADKPPAVPERLNEQQQAAVLSGFRKTTMFVWGPPGTGKTWTLGALAVALAKAGRKVLVLAPTHAAVDGATRAVFAHSDPHDVEQGWLLRFGPFEDCGDVPPQMVALRYRAHNIVRAKLDELQARIEHIDHLLAPWKAAHDIEQSEHSSLDRLREQFAEAELKRARAQADLASSRGCLMALEGLSWLYRWFKTADIKRARDAAAVANEQYRAAAGERDSISGSVASGVLAYDAARAELARIQDDIVRTTSSQPDALREERNRLIRDARRGSMQSRDDAENNVLAQARIICATVTSSYTNPRLSSCHFDYVILDEASMVNLAAALLVLSRSGHSAVFGDFRQLPPIVVAESAHLPGKPQETVGKILGNDIFEFSRIRAAVDDGRDDPRLSILRTQYRAPEELVRIYNGPFYGGRLQTPADRQGPSANTPSAVVLDTSRLRPRCARYPQWHQSWANPVHIDVIERILRDLLGSGVREVSLISPFSCQASLLRGMAKNHKRDGLTIRSATIHRFQGQESEAVIFDTTISPEDNGRGPMWPPDFYMPQPNDARLLNVAISRAKSRLYILANLEFLQGWSRPGAIIWKVFNSMPTETVPAPPGS